jgi:tripartite-type tricarboxylate transporter receptor subunit TctC
VKIVVAFAPDRTAGPFARLLAVDHVQAGIYLQIAGSAGAIGSSQVARAFADGYTLLIGGAGPLLTSPASNPNVGYDTLRDFTQCAP